MTRTLLLSHTDLVHNRGPYVEGWQRTFNHTRKQAHYAKLREALHEQMRHDIEAAKNG